MTPKEKADYLVRVFRSQLPYYTENDNIKKAKQCAIITVNVILNDVGAKDWEDDEFTSGNYWQQVKEEIEKL